MRVEWNLPSLRIIRVPRTVSIRGYELDEESEVAVTPADLGLPWRAVIHGAPDIEGCKRALVAFAPGLEELTFVPTRMRVIGRTGDQTMVEVHAVNIIRR